jgi:hypothetical protein
MTRRPESACLHKINQKMPVHSAARHLRVQKLLPKHSAEIKFFAWD